MSCGGGLLGSGAVACEASGGAGAVGPLGSARGWGSGVDDVFGGAECPHGGCLVLLAAVVEFGGHVFVGAECSSAFELDAHVEGFEDAAGAVDD